MTVRSDTFLSYDRALLTASRIALLSLPLLGLTITLVLLRLSLSLFPKIKLLDFPERYGLQRPRLPYPAGIIPVIVSLCLLSTVLPPDQQSIGLLLGIAVIVGTSFIDDRTPLPAWLRLVLHTVSTLIIFASGTHIYTITNPLGGILKLDSIDVLLPGLGPLPLLSAMFTVAWLLLTTNALNWSDGVPGNTSAISTVGFLLVGLLSLLRNDQPEIARIAFILAGCSLACLPFELPHRRVLLGDTGAMFFGLTLGILGILQGGKVATAFLALGVPIADALLVTFERLLHRHSPLRGGKDHLHDLLTSAGWSAGNIVAFSACIGGIFGTVALFSSTTEKGALGLLLFILIGLLRRSLRQRNKAK